jgi:saccharopine dehydrogenase-like NADP-dependent oxidoreductase
MRVGALPKFPSNALGYNLTWSTDGVINEYCEPCEAIIEGKLTETPPLEEVEALAIDGVQYEAFNTSGGLGTLPHTLLGKVRNLNYRTMRYPGHAAIMKLLLNDLRMRDTRDVLKSVMEHALPMTQQDVVIVFVTVSGMKDGKLMQLTYANKVYSQDVQGRTRTAIQVTTAAGICAVLDMLASGALTAKGFVKQEDIALDAFLANRFGKYYATPDYEAVVSSAKPAAVQAELVNA